MHQRRSMPWLGLSLLVACSGGQTGGENSDPFCVDGEVEVVALSDASHAGFSADQVLDFAEGEHTSDARWPFIDSAPAEATLRITRTAEEARYIDTHWSSPGTKGEGCPDRIEVDVSVELTLSNGGGMATVAFDSLLTATSAGEARLQQRLVPEDLEGDVQFALGPKERLSQLELVARLAPDVSSATLIATAKAPIQADGYVYYTERPGTVASWPTGDECGEGGQPVARDAFDLGVSPETFVDALPRELEVEWQDGTSTKATLQLAVAGVACITDACDGWCPGLIDDGDGASETRTAIVLPVQVGISTDDGRWQGGFVAELWIEMFVDGRIAGAYLRYDSQHAAGEVVETDLGLEGVSVDGAVTAVLLLECKERLPMPEVQFSGILSASGSLVVSDSGRAIMTAQLASPPVERPDMLKLAE
jgi:hypothetical protein